MFDTIAGLPLHPLVVHATEVTVPLAALVLVVAAFWPRFRAWAGYLPVILSFAAVILVPISTQSGEALQEHLAENPLIRTHAEMAEGLLPWVLGLLIASGALLWWTRNERTGAAPREPRTVMIVIMVAVVLVTAGTMVQAIRIGHSGATAVWSTTVAAKPAG